MSESTEVEAAALVARAARERLMATAHQLQTEIAPSRLLDEAVTNVKDGATALALTSTEAARRRPGVAAGIAAAGALLLLRGPLWRGLGRMFGRRKRKPPRED